MAWWDDVGKSFNNTVKGVGDFAGEVTGVNAAKRAKKNEKIESNQAKDENTARDAMLASASQSVKNRFEGLTPEQVQAGYTAKDLAADKVTGAQMGNVAGVKGASMAGAKNVSAEGRQAQNEAAAGMAQKQAQFAEQQAQGEAQRASAQAGQQAQRQARTAGLNPAQAAMLAQDQAANAYTNTLSTAKQANAQNFAGQQGTAGTQAGQQLQAQQANQGAQLQAQQTNAQLAQQANLSNQAVQATQAQTNAQLAQQAALANQSAGLQAGQINNQAQQTQAQLAQQAAQANNQATLGFTGAAQSADQQAEAAKLAKLQGAAGSINAGISNTDALPAFTNTMNMIGNAASAISDENLKDEVTDTSPDISSVRSVEYRYKPEVGEGTEKRVGVLAQDLEKTPLKAVVKDTPQGKKVDTPQLTLANTSMIADLTRKLDRVFKMYGEMM